MPTNIDSLHRANSLRIVCGMCDAHRSSSDYLPTNTGIRLRVGEANAVGSNVTLLSSVLPESRVRGCLDATHSVSRETVFGRRQQRRTALSVTCISWVRPSTSIRPLSRQKRFTWNQATPMKRFRQRCTQVWILPVSVSRLSCHRKLKTTPLLHSARGAVTRPTGVEQAFLSIKGLTGSPLQHTIHQPVVQRPPRVSRSSATAGSSSRDSSTATQRCQRLHEAGSAVLRGEVSTNDHSKTVSSQASIPAAVSVIAPRCPWFHVEQRSK